MIKRLFFPFGEVSKSTRFAIIAFWIICFLLLFEITHSKIIPAPTTIGKSIITLLSTDSFYDDLISSLITTLKAMFYSILATTVIVYLSTIQAFKPLAEFVSKCRYLTLTGLVFVFTVVSSDAAQLKMYLLMFGIIPFFVTSFLSVVQNAPVEERWKGYVNRLNRWETLWEVTIVGKLDMLFEVMRQNFAISWMMITMVEGYAMSGLICDYLLSLLRSSLFPYLQTRK